MANGQLPPLPSGYAPTPHRLTQAQADAATLPKLPEGYSFQKSTPQQAVQTQTDDQVRAARNWVQKLTGGAGTSASEWHKPTMASTVNFFNNLINNVGDLGQVAQQLPSDLAANWQQYKHGIFDFPTRPGWMGGHPGNLPPVNAINPMDALRDIRSGYQLARHPTAKGTGEALANLAMYNVPEIRRREAAGDQAGALSQQIADLPFQLGLLGFGEIGPRGIRGAGELSDMAKGQLSRAGERLARYQQTRMARGLGKIPYTGGAPAGISEPLGRIHVSDVSPNIFGPSRTMPGQISPETVWQRPQSGITPLQASQRQLMLPGVREVTPTHPPTITPRRLVLTPEELQVKQSQQTQLSREASEAGREAAARGKAGAKLDYQQRQELARRGYSAQQMNRLTKAQIEKIFGGT